MKYLVNITEETERIAHDFISTLLPNVNGATVVGLYGDLGAGKTFFTQCVARKIGLLDNIVSPTFVIEKIYRLDDRNKNVDIGFDVLIHIDAYRIEDSKELISLSWNQIIRDPKNLILIEWPERVIDIMPEHIKISFKHMENQTSREIEIVM